MYDKNTNKNDIISPNIIPVTAIAQLYFKSFVIKNEDKKKTIATLMHCSKI